MMMKGDSIVGYPNNRLSGANGFDIYLYVLTNL